jgi:hypothetical protein
VLKGCTGHALARRLVDVGCLLNPAKVPCRRWRVLRCRCRGRCVALKSVEQCHGLPVERGLASCRLRPVRLGHHLSRRLVIAPSLHVRMLNLRRAAGEPSPDVFLHDILVEDGSLYLRLERLRMS